MNVEISNGRNCKTCNKENVCKYCENMILEVNILTEMLNEKTLPLSVNMNCREWSGVENILR